jgi:hypothetical protein
LVKKKKVKLAALFPYNRHLHYRQQIHLSVRIVAHLPRIVVTSAVDSLHSVKLNYELIRVLGALCEVRYGTAGTELQCYGKLWYIDMAGGLWIYYRFRVAVKSKNSGLLKQSAITITFFFWMMYGPGNESFQYVRVDRAFERNENKIFIKEQA